MNRMIRNTQLKPTKDRTYAFFNTVRDAESNTIRRESSINTAMFAHTNQEGIKRGDDRG